MVDSMHLGIHPKDHRLLIDFYAAFRCIHMSCLYMHLFLQPAGGNYQLACYLAYDQYTSISINPGCHKYMIIDID